MQHTLHEIETKLKNLDFGSYALLIGYQDIAWQFMSNDVNLDTYFYVTLDKAFRIHIKEPLGMTRTTYHVAMDEKNMVLCNHREDLGGLIYDDDNVRQLRGIPAGNGGTSDAHRYPPRNQKGSGNLKISQKRG